MIIVTFRQKCLIKHNYFVCKDAQTFADDGNQKKSECILPSLFLKALSSVNLPFLYKSCYFCHLLTSYKSFQNKESRGIYLEGKCGAQAVYFCVLQNLPKDRMCLCLPFASGRGKEGGGKVPRTDSDFGI